MYTKISTYAGLQGPLRTCWTPVDRSGNMEAEREEVVDVEIELYLVIVLIESSLTINYLLAPQVFAQFNLFTLL